MFWNEQNTEEIDKQKSKVEALAKELGDTRHKQTLDLAELESIHKLALKEKEFELKHFKDEEMKKLGVELEKQKKDNAVLTKENEMLVKITDLNADVIDVKELVGSLIKKLPEINLTSLTVQTTEKK